MTKPRIVQVISGTNKSIAFEILAEGFMAQNIDISYVLIQNSESAFSKFLSSLSIPYSIVNYKGKKDYPAAILKVRKILREKQPNIVHTHLREASLIGLSAAKLANVPIRIHTRHHSTSNHLYHPSSVKYDRLINKLSTAIVSISINVSNILNTYEHVLENKIHIINHGLRLEDFSEKKEDDKLRIKSKYGLNHTHTPIVGAISRYEKLKGLQHIVPAFKKFKEQNKNAHLVLANANGLDKEYVASILDQNLDPDDYTEISFEEDLYSLYAIFDYFVHVPIDHSVEAFGQTYIEALASKTPSVFTLSGIANEIIEDNVNALVVPHQSTNSIFEALMKLHSDKDLCLSLVKRGAEVAEQFSSTKYVNDHVDLYHKLCLQNDNY